MEKKKKTLPRSFFYCHDGIKIVYSRGSNLCAKGRVEAINISNPIHTSGSGTYWKRYVRSTFACEPRYTRRQEGRGDGDVGRKEW